MAKFQKGNSGNPNGRPKGSGNRTPAALREMLADTTAQELARLPETMEKATVGERLRFLAAALPYLLPRLQPDPPIDSIQAMQAPSVIFVGPDYDDTNESLQVSQ